MPVYLDHAATTPLRPEVLEAMTPFLGGMFGNPSSTHAFGRAAREALDDAHERLARPIGAESREIVFTSGGTEANNLALKGAAWAGKARGHRLVTTAVEHHAVGHALALPRALRVRGRAGPGRPLRARRPCRHRRARSTSGRRSSP